MRVGIIGAGHIGGGIARRLTLAGHEVIVSFARDRAGLADRMPGARYTKSFNTLTAGFQAQAAARPASERVVQWVAGDDNQAKTVVSALITDAGFVPADLGGIDDCAVMEAPRRPGAVYGEEYRAADAAAVVAAVRAGKPIPPAPAY